jgi:hypothetical protein
MKKIILPFLLLFFFHAYAQLPSYVPANGLIAWWSFNGNANDESGNNNNGTINGAVLTADRFGNGNSAYSFDGTNSYISIPSSSSLESPTTQLTMSAWVKLAGYSLVGQAFDPILAKSNSSANAFMYRFTVDINGISFYAGINNWTTNTGAAYNFSLNQWYLLTAVLDSFASYLYLNDSLVATNVFTTSIATDNLPLEIGRDVMGSTEVFNGIIDDIGIWHVALTQQQVTNLYVGPTVGIPESLGETQLNIFPNPASVSTSITISSDKDSKLKAKLFSMDGKEISYFEMMTNEPKVILLSSYTPGIYYLKIETSENQVLVKKIIVIK